LVLQTRHYPCRAAKDFSVFRSGPLRRKTPKTWLCRLRSDFAPRSPLRSTNSRSHIVCRNHRPSRIRIPKSVCVNRLSIVRLAARCQGRVPLPPRTSTVDSARSATAWLLRLHARATSLPLHLRRFTSLETTRSGAHRLDRVDD
jgi:hypothetical protein